MSTRFGYSNRSLTTWVWPPLAASMIIVDPSLNKLSHFINMYIKYVIIDIMCYKKHVGFFFKNVLSESVNLAKENAILK